jgi:hypothetical protein
MQREVIAEDKTGAIDGSSILRVCSQDCLFVKGLPYVFMFNEGSLELSFFAF